MLCLDKSLFFSPRYWINDDVNIEISSSYREGESHLEFFGKSVSKYHDYVISPKIHIEHYLNGIKNTTIAGFDYGHQKQDYFGKKNLRNQGYYLYNTSTLLEDRLFLDLGYRSERYKLNIDGSNQDFAPENLDASTLGITYSYARNSKAFVSYDNSFRYQRTDELGGASFNEAIAPQKTRTFQIGFAHEINDQLNFALTYFRIDTENEIFYENNIVFQNVSYANTKREGYEFELNYQYSEDLDLFLNYTNMDTELGRDTASANGHKGNNIPSIPEQTLNAGYSWNFLPNFNWTTAGKWADRFNVRSDYANSQAKDDGYIVVDSKITFTWDWFSIYSGCNNVFDEKYNNNASIDGEFPAPGRNFFGGMSMTFNF